MYLTKPKVSVEDALKEPEKWIPEGIYCYRPDEFDGHIDIFNGTAYLCPFWDADYNKDTMECGYCHYLKWGDWEADRLSLLWDMCKECGVNDYEEGY